MPPWNLGTLSYESWISNIQGLMVIHYPVYSPFFFKWDGLIWKNFGCYFSQFESPHRYSFHLQPSKIVIRRNFGRSPWLLNFIKLLIVDVWDILSYISILIFFSLSCFVLLISIICVAYILHKLYVKYVIKQLMDMDYCFLCS